MHGCIASHLIVLTYLLALANSTWNTCLDNNQLLRTFPLPQSSKLKMRPENCQTAASNGCCEWRDDRSVYLFPWRRACPQSCGLCQNISGVGSTWAPASDFDITSTVSAASLDLGDDDAACDLTRITYSGPQDDEYIQQQFIDAEIPVIVQGLVQQWQLAHWVKDALEESTETLLQQQQQRQPSYFIQQELRRVQHIGYNQYGDLLNYPKQKYLRKKLQSSYTPPWNLLGKDYIRSECNQTIGKPQWHHKWILIAGEGTSSAWHIDQFNTTAWNTVLHGRKKWLLYPPSDAPPGMRDYLNSNGAPKATDMNTYDYYGQHRSPWGDEMPWSLTGSKLAKQHASYFHRVQEKKLPENMLQCMLRANETLILPSGWWHAVLNTHASIAVTENLMSRSSFVRVLKELRARPVGTVPWKCAQKLTKENEVLGEEATKLNRFGDRKIQMWKKNKVKN